MRLIVIFLGLTMVLAGCSVQNKLIREYKGKTQEDLLLTMGRPSRSEKTDGGGVISIYEKSKFLKATTINTGQFQYDRFESPKTIKTEVYKFFFSPAGLIEDVKYEVSYAR